MNTPAPAPFDSPDTSDLNRAGRVFREEADALIAIAARLGSESGSTPGAVPGFVRAVELVLACPGRVVLTGMGKHGLVARKIAATLASTGTPSLFLHPAEGRHGDLGMVAPEDVVIAVSNSGGTDEVLGCLPFLKHNGNAVIAMTGRLDSPLARAADAVLDIAVEREACPLNLAPTTSTTAAMAMGDALAVVLMERRRFQPGDFALRHPAGALGRRLLLTVADLAAGKTNPVAPETATFAEALATITAGGRGAVSVVDPGGNLAGIFTDGDMRRALVAATAAGRRLDETMAAPVAAVMTANPLRVGLQALAVEALELMENGPRKVLVLPVVDDAGRPAGMIQLHDLVAAGI